MSAQSSQQADQPVFGKGRDAVACDGPHDIVDIVGHLLRGEMGGNALAQLAVDRPINMDDCRIAKVTRDRPVSVVTRVTSSHLVTSQEIRAGT